MTALRLHVDPRTGCQAVAIDQFSRRHILVSVAVSFQQWRPSLCGCDFGASLLLLTTDSFGAANSDWKRRNRRNGSGQQLIVVRGAVLAANHSAEIILKVELNGYEDRFLGADEPGCRGVLGYQVSCVHSPFE